MATKRFCAFVLVVAFTVPTFGASQKCSTALSKVASWMSWQSLRFGSRESYYPLKKTLSILYPASGQPSPIKVKLMDYFPQLLTEMENERLQNSQAAKSVREHQALPSDENQIIQIYDSQPGVEFISKQDFEPFEKEFLRLLALRRDKGGDGRTGSNAFKKWAVHEIKQYRIKAEMERLILAGHTFETLFNVELERRFRESGYLNSTRLEQWIHDTFDNPAIFIPTLGLYKTYRRASVLIVSGMFVAIPVNVINAVKDTTFKAPSTAASQWWKQFSNPITTRIQNFFIDTTTAKKQAVAVETLKKDMSNVNIQEIAKLPPEQGEKKLNEELAKVKPDVQPVAEILNQQQRLYEAQMKDDPDFQKLAVKLNNHENNFITVDGVSGGRSLFWSSQVFFPQDMAMRVATFDNTRLLYQMNIENHTDKLKALKASSHPDEKAIAELEMTIKGEQQGLEVSKRQIAKTLAIWKINEFIFPELTQKWLDGKELGELTATYNKFKEDYGFSYFAAAYQQQINETLKNLHEMTRIREAVVAKNGN